MSQTDNNDIGASLSPESIARGHGQFPYVIVRMHYAIYMQMPIHFTSVKTEGLKGIIVHSQSENNCNNTERLLEVTAKYKQDLDAKNNRNHRICLVIEKDQAYYFEEGEIRFNTSIPSGGTLVNSNKQVIAMAQSHFIQQ
jgi:hypothetical protein